MSTLDRRGNTPEARSKSSLDDASGRRNQHNTHRVTDQARRAAALVLTSVAMGDDGPDDLPRYRRLELREVLESLGLVEPRPVADEVPKKRPRDDGGKFTPPVEEKPVRSVSTSPPPACREFAGTERGYNRHINVYETPCNPCLTWRTSALAERWEGLGLMHGTYVRLPE